MSESELYKALAEYHDSLVTVIISTKEQATANPETLPRRIVSDDDTFSPNSPGVGPATRDDEDSLVPLRSLSSTALVVSPRGLSALQLCTSAEGVPPSHRPPMLGEGPLGEVTPVTSFRKRRLTMADSKPLSTMDPINFPKRASIFSSTEINGVAETTAPFSNDVLGTFSCHGIEPEYSADDEEIGVLQKVNQDRGCVVYPFNRSRAQALFMVLDGHGPQGNMVSEHVMRKVT